MINEANWAEATQADGEFGPRDPGESDTFSLSGLLPDTDYWFALKVGDEAGNWSPLSNVVEGRTTR